jgi:membrane protease YdiL (CAAX protease family)
MPEPTTPAWFLAAMAIACWLSAAIGLAIAVRMWRGRPVLRYQPRRQVPWQGIDLLVIVVVYVVTLWRCQEDALRIMGPEITRPPAMVNVGETSAAHSVAKMLQDAPPWMYVLCGLSVVVVAPIFEEFLFRVLLQGWLESRRASWKRKLPTLRRLAPGAVGPMVAASFLFALIHFRVDAPPRHPHFHLGMMLATSVTSLLSMTFAVLWLRWRVKATAADLGWAPQRFWGDVRTGVVAYLAVAAPLFIVQIGLAMALPKYLAPDPLTLFLFALLLGTLYHRTHRGVPAMVAHAMLNATSLALLWFQSANSP